MRLILEQAILAAYHHGNLAEMDIGKEALLDTLLASVRVINLHIGDIDVDEERSRICEVPQTSIIGHHRKNRTVILKDGRLLELGIREL
jgi:hypothetical protein